MISSRKFNIKRYLINNILPSLFSAFIVYYFAIYKSSFFKYLSLKKQWIITIIGLIIVTLIISYLFNLIVHFIKNNLNDLIKISASHALIDLKSVYRITFDTNRSISDQKWGIYDKERENKCSLQIQFQKEISMNALQIITDQVKGFGIQYPDGSDLKINATKCFIHAKCDKNKHIVVYFYIQGEKKMYYVEYSTETKDFFSYEHGMETYLSYAFPNKIKDGRWHFIELDFLYDFNSKIDDKYHYLRNIKIRGPITISRIDFSK